jgi:hypothetical protein
MRPLALALGTLSLLALPACPMPPSQAARMQEAATDLNTNVRFGRMELAMEHVAPDARESFISHRRLWGSRIHLADYELVGASMKDDDNAEVSVKYAWFHPDEGDLHTTVVRQKWHDRKGDWLLVGEARIDGDEGLFGEAPLNPGAAAPQRPRHQSVQFPTVRFEGE